MSVSADSLVFEAGISATYEYEGTRDSLDWSYTVEELGDVTVAEPDWVETARERTG